MRARGDRVRFVAINCAAIPHTLLEAELFGVEAGAFTDARQRKPGLFQAADHGTLFLDEVGALPRDLQAKLLTAIEDRVVRRLGSVKSEAVDVWIMSATSADLEAEDFRADLYHRLATLTLWLPPLRDRGSDIQLLAAEFLSRACADYGRAPKRLGPDAQAALGAYRWPGNVRELANAMERVALMADAPVITAADLGLDQGDRPASPSANGDAEPASGLTDSLRRFERAQLMEALEATKWNVLQAAQQLGLPRTTLRHRIAKYRLTRHGEPFQPPADRRALGARVAERRPPSPGGYREERTVTFLMATLELVAPSTMEILIEKIEGFGGQLVEMGPSGIMAAFGLTSIEDGPNCAARAALAVRNTLAHGFRDSATPTGDQPRFALALHASPLLVDHAGEVSGPVQLTVPPDHPCRSALQSLVSAAEPDSILVSLTTARLLERRFGVAPESTSRRAGRVLLGPEPSGLGLAGRPLTPLVGRGTELGMLQAILARAESGQGQVVGLIGEPGVGKSRLVYEFRESLKERRITYLEGHCLSSGNTTPYAVLLDLVQQAMGIGELDSASAIAEKTHQHLRRLGLDPETSAPYLLNLLGVKPGADSPNAASPEAMKRRTFETLRRMCLDGSRERPVVVAVEDLHWIDPTSREFLASLVDPIAGARFLLLATCRPGCELPGLARSHVSQIAVSRLSSRESLAIVRAARRGSADPRPPPTKSFRREAEIPSCSRS